MGQWATVFLHLYFSSTGIPDVRCHTWLSAWVLETTLRSFSYVASTPPTMPPPDLRSLSSLSRLNLQCPSSVSAGGDEPFTSRASREVFRSLGLWP